MWYADYIVVRRPNLRMADQIKWGAPWKNERKVYLPDRDPPMRWPLGRISGETKRITMQINEVLGMQPYILPQYFTRSGENKSVMLSMCLWYMIAMATIIYKHCH